MTTLTKAVKRTATVPKMPHGFKNRLVITLYPGAILGVRESRGKDELLLNIGDWYGRALVRAALQAQRKKGR